MSNELKKTNQQITAKTLFSQPNVKGKFEELLGKRSTAFMTSVLQIVSQNEMLSKSEPQSVFHAAAVAATLDLPLNSNLGFAYIVPYNQSYKDDRGQWQKKQVAQFQMGYKGFIQLALRSGQFKNISATEIYEGQLIEENPLTGFVFDFSKKSSDVVIGYAAYFALLNGFEKTLYMPLATVKSHGKKYSQTFKTDKGLWKDEFDVMAVKTVLKLLLSKFAPLSVEMQKAVTLDQAVINNVDGTDYKYADNDVIPVEPIDKELERLTLMISDCKTIEEVEKLQESWPDYSIELFDARKEELKNAAK